MPALTILSASCFKYGGYLRTVIADAQSEIKAGRLPDNATIASIIEGMGMAQGCGADITLTDASAWGILNAWVKKDLHELDNELGKLVKSTT